MAVWHYWHFDLKLSKSDSQYLLNSVSDCNRVEKKCPYLSMLCRKLSTLTYNRS